ncbi:hypothetical protein O5D80_007286 [Batrachochytrium dendrobatidis]|nr:hypothetical protein O5D80_007286 [Batrachochytrium dendrobatidis]
MASDWLNASLKKFYFNQQKCHSISELARDFDRQVINYLIVIDRLYKLFPKNKHTFTIVCDIIESTLGYNMDVERASLFDHSFGIFDALRDMLMMALPIMANRSKHESCLPAEHNFLWGLFYRNLSMGLSGDSNRVLRPSDQVFDECISDLDMTESGSPSYPQLQSTFKILPQKSPIALPSMQSRFTNAPKTPTVMIRVESMHQNQSDSSTVYPSKPPRLASFSSKPDTAPLEDIGLLERDSVEALLSIWSCALSTNETMVQKLTPRICHYNASADHTAKCSHTSQKFKAACGGKHGTLKHGNAAGGSNLARNSAKELSTAKSSKTKKAIGKRAVIVLKPPSLVSESSTQNSTNASSIEHCSLSSVDKESFLTEKTAHRAVFVCSLAQHTPASTHAMIQPVSIPKISKDTNLINYDFPRQVPKKSIHVNTSALQMDSGVDMSAICFNSASDNTAKSDGFSPGSTTSSIAITDGEKTTTTPSATTPNTPTDTTHINGTHGHFSRAMSTGKWPTKSCPQLESDSPSDYAREILCYIVKSFKSQPEYIDIFALISSSVAPATDSNGSANNPTAVLDHYLDRIEKAQFKTIGTFYTELMADLERIEIAVLMQPEEERTYLLAALHKLRTFHSKSWVHYFPSTVGGRGSRRKLVASSLATADTSHSTSPTTSNFATDFSFDGIIPHSSKKTDIFGKRSKRSTVETAMRPSKRLSLSL